MGIVQNTRTLIISSQTRKNYLNYCASRLVNQGQAKRKFPGGIVISSFNNFSEYNTCDQATPSEWKFFQHYAVGSGVIIDIGANLGLISMIFAKRFPERQIHAFEPDLSTYQSLLANIELNTLKNVFPHRIAIAGVEGKIPFSSNPRSRATNRVTSMPDEYTVSVPCTTLDAFTEKHSIKEISFLKIDVEGHETDVLVGAVNTLKNLRPRVIYYEVCPALTKNEGYDPLLPTRMLLDNGYHVCEINSDGNLRAANSLDVSNIELTNWVAVAT